MKNVIISPMVLTTARLGGRRLFAMTAKLTGYGSAAGSWVAFARHRTAIGFLRAGINTGFAVGRVHPVINLSVSVLDAAGVTDRALRGVESVVRRRLT